MYVFVRDPLTNTYVKEHVPDASAGFSAADFLTFKEEPTTAQPIIKVVEPTIEMAGVGEVFPGAASPVRPRSGFASILPTWMSSRFR